MPNRPSAGEERAADYCRRHPLARPEVNLPKVFAALLSYILAVAVFAALYHRAGGRHAFLLAEAVTIASFLLAGKRVGVTAVRIYQRYAPEKTRRQCRCMPSCSEYALLALEKYPWPVAYRKIWRRLTHTCQQPGYHTDYP